MFSITCGAFARNFNAEISRTFLDRFLDHHRRQKRLPGLPNRNVLSRGTSFFLKHPGFRRQLISAYMQAQAAE
jgi:hypothetical protein